MWCISHGNTCYPITLLNTLLGAKKQKTNLIVLILKMVYGVEFGNK